MRCWPWIVILMVIFIAVEVEGHRRRNRNRNRYYRKQRRRYHTDYSSSSNDVHYSHSDSDVIACEFSNSMLRETRECPYDYNCTTGPFQVKFGEEIGNYKFCNIPLKDKDACKIIHQNSGDILKQESCPADTNCSAGPIAKSHYWFRYSDIKLYFCGDTLPPLPTLDVYERLFTAKACSVNGTVTNYCSFWDRRLRWLGIQNVWCNGITAEINTAHGTDSLQFCREVDDDFRYIKLWGTPYCRGTRFDINVEVIPKEMTTPKSPSSTTSSPRSDPDADDGNTSDVDPINPELPEKPEPDGSDQNPPATTAPPRSDPDTDDGNTSEVDPINPELPEQPEPNGNGQNPDSVDNPSSSVDDLFP